MLPNSTALHQSVVGAEYYIYTCGLDLFLTSDSSNTKLRRKCALCPSLLFWWSLWRWRCVYFSFCHTELLYLRTQHDRAERAVAKVKVEGIKRRGPRHLNRCAASGDLQVVSITFLEHDRMRKWKSILSNGIMHKHPPIGNERNR